VGRLLTAETAKLPSRDHEKGLIVNDRLWVIHGGRLRQSKYRVAFLMTVMRAVGATGIAPRFLPTVPE
jgi:hypothetical protein